MKTVATLIATIAVAASAFATEPSKPTPVAAKPAPVSTPAKKEVAKPADTKSDAAPTAKAEAPKK